jgi:alkaline phosphatase
MIEEQIEFTNALGAIVSYLDANIAGNNWSNTLVLVSSDHETGMLWGPASDTTAFAALVANVAWVMPGMKFNAGGHTNSLVPVFARGPGAELLPARVDGTDPVRGAYLDNTDIFAVMAAAIPEPAALSILLLSCVMLGRRRVH